MTAPRATTVDELVDLIHAAYPATGGAGGFLADAGGWLAYLDICDPDDEALALAAIERIEKEQS